MTSAALTSLGEYDVIGNQLQQLIAVHRNAITIIPLAHTETLSSNGADQRAGGDGGGGVHDVSRVTLDRLSPIINILEPSNKQQSV